MNEFDKQHEKMQGDVVAAKLVWKALSEIDCSEHTKEKGDFTYLSWAWAWGMLRNSFPAVYVYWEEDVVGEFEGVIVQCRVRIDTHVGSTVQSAFLPVLNFQNKPISKPTAFDYNTTRQPMLNQRRLPCTAWDTTFTPVKTYLTSRFRTSRPTRRATSTPIHT